MMVFTPQIIHFNMAFHYFHRPFWDTTIFGNTHLVGATCAGVSLETYQTYPSNMWWRSSQNGFHMLDQAWFVSTLSSMLLRFLFYTEHNLSVSILLVTTATYNLREGCNFIMFWTTLALSAPNPNPKYRSGCPRCWFQLPTFQVGQGILVSRIIPLTQPPLCVFGILCHGVGWQSHLVVRHCLSEQWKKGPVLLVRLYKGWNTTQLYRDYNKPL